MAVTFTKDDYYNRLKKAFQPVQPVVEPAMDTTTDSGITPEDIVRRTGITSDTTLSPSAIGMARNMPKPVFDKNQYLQKIKEITTPVMPQAPGTLLSGPMSAGQMSAVQRNTRIKSSMDELWTENLGLFDEGGEPIPGVLEQKQDELKNLFYDKYGIDPSLRNVLKPLKIEIMSKDDPYASQVRAYILGDKVKIPATMLGMDYKPKGNEISYISEILAHEFAHQMFKNLSPQMKQSFTNLLESKKYKTLLTATGGDPVESYSTILAQLPKLRELIPAELDQFYPGVNMNVLRNPNLKLQGWVEDQPKPSDFYKGTSVPYQSSSTPMTLGGSQQAALNLRKDVQQKSQEVGKPVSQREYIESVNTKQVEPQDTFYIDAEGNYNFRNKSGTAARVPNLEEAKNYVEKMGIDPIQVNPPEEVKKGFFDRPISGNLEEQAKYAEGTKGGSTAPWNLSPSQLAAAPETQLLGMATTPFGLASNATFKTLTGMNKLGYMADAAINTAYGAETLGETIAKRGEMSPLEMAGRILLGGAAVAGGVYQAKAGADLLAQGAKKAGKTTEQFAQEVIANAKARGLESGAINPEVPKPVPPQDINIASKPTNIAQKVTPEVKPTTIETPVSPVGESGKVPPVKSPTTVETPQDSVRSWWTKVAGQASKAEQATDTLRTEWNRQRFGSFQSLFEELTKKGTSIEDAINQATSQLKGKMPFQKIKLGDVLDTPTREQMFNVLTEKYTGAKLVGAKSALTKLLDTNRLPYNPDAPYGAYNLLTDAFGKDVVDEMVNTAKKMGGIGEPTALDPNLLAYIRDLPQRPSRQRAFFEEPVPFGQEKNKLTYEPTEKLGFEEQPQQAKMEVSPVEGITPRPETRTPEQLAMSKLKMEGFPGTKGKASYEPTGKLGLESQSQQLGMEVSPIENWTPSFAGKYINTLKSSQRVKLATALNKLGINVIDALNIPRSIQASFDLSAGGRQGLILGTRHPIEWLKSWVPSLKALKSEELGRKVNDLILNDFDVQMGIQKGYIDLPDLKPGASYLAREESFSSTIAERISKTLSKYHLGFLGTRPYERAYVVFLNALRAGVWKQGVKALQKSGIREILNPEYQQLGEYINLATGRGKIPKSVAGAAKLANATLFAPRLLFARIQLPKMLFSSSPYVRKEAWKTLGTFLGFGATVLGTYKLLTGRDPELDPRSSEFGKLRFGDTRVDVWGGYLQYARFVSQLATAERKYMSGEIDKVARWDLIQNFIQSKDSPAMSLFIDIMSGKDYMGEPVDLSKESVTRQAYNRLAPLFVQDLIEAAKADGVTGALAAVPGAFGAGVTTYGEGASELLAQSTQDEKFKNYYAIPSDPDEAKKQGLLTRTDYLISNPQVDAKLFATSQGTSIKTVAGANYAIKLIQDNQINPADIESLTKYYEDNPDYLGKGYKDISPMDILAVKLSGQPLTPEYKYRENQLTLKEQWRVYDSAYNAVSNPDSKNYIADEDARATKRAEVLSRNPEYATARHRMDAYSQGIPEAEIDAYVNYKVTEDEYQSIQYGDTAKDNEKEAAAREAFLKSHPAFRIEKYTKACLSTDPKASATIQSSYVAYFSITGENQSAQRLAYRKTHPTFEKWLETYLGYKPPTASSSSSGGTSRGEGNPF